MRGRVYGAYGTRYEVLLATGDRVQVKAKGRRLKPIAGDFVTLSADGAGDSVITDVEPRSNAFPRVTRGGERVDLVANLDLVVIVIAPKPQPSRDLVNKYLVACALIDIPAAVYLHKSDLLDARAEAGWRRRQRLLQPLGYRTGEGRVKPEPDLDGLHALLGTGTSVLVGQSGVGKSSLIGALVPTAAPKTSALSRSTGKGRHTTTAAQLFTLPTGGTLVDSPGVWEYGLWAMSPSELADGFVEFRHFQHRCRFSDCRHLSEPACAVREAVEAGEIHDARYASYVRLAA